MRVLRTALALAMAVLLPQRVFAGETGSISGVVKDSQGGVLPGAVVKISGPMLPGGREITTSANGSYQFQRLLPGVYTVRVSMSGLGDAVREIRVGVDVDAQVGFTLSPTASEELTVSAEAPTVDLRNSEVGFNYTAEVIKDLPLQRSYSGLFQLIPGIAENKSFAPAGGGSRQDNTFLMDGVNITNATTGGLSTEINELDIVEFNIKRGAISASGGRTAGFVANAVSKSGTNKFSGAARFEFQSKSLFSDPKDKIFGDVPFEYLNPAISAGGPLMKNKLFWYGSARYFKTTTSDRVNQENTALPDRVSKGRELNGKITATPTQKHLISLNYRARPQDITGASLFASSSPSIATVDDNGSRIATASWTFFPTGRTTVDVKYIYLKENSNAIPVTALGYLPTPFNPNNLGAMGQFTDPARANLNIGGQAFSDNRKYVRQELKGSFGQFFDLGRTEHQVQVGFGYEFTEEALDRLSNGWGALVRQTQAGVPVIRARSYFTQPAQLGQGRTWSAYVQDDVKVSSRLTLNLGVLANKDEFAQDLKGSNGCPSPAFTQSGLPGGIAVFESKGDRCTFVRFNFADEIQPRVGFNFNVREGKGDKFYGNWGRYYNMDQKSAGRSWAPRRIFLTQTFFRLDGSILSQAPLASTTGKQIDPDLKPIYHDEIVAGYATPINPDLSLDVFYMYRDINNVMEDVPTVLPNNGPYAAANLPCARYESCRGVVAERKYRGVTVELNRRMKNKWGANLSYTWSKFEGNFDLDYAGGATFNTSSTIQDGPGGNVEEPNRYGLLNQDRPHVVKLFGTFQPAERFNLGVYFRVQSGRAWNAVARDNTGNGTIINYLEKAGSRRTPTWSNLDLLAAYRLPIGERGITLEARVLNLLNTQTVLSYNPQQFNDLNVAANGSILPYTTPNPLFNTPNSYATPRRILLSALMSF